MNREQIYIEFAKCAASNRDYYVFGTYGIIEDVLAMFGLQSHKFQGAKNCVHEDNLKKLHDFIISENCTDEQAEMVYRIAKGNVDPIKTDLCDKSSGKVFVGMVMNNLLYADVDLLRQSITDAIVSTRNEPYFADESPQGEFIIDGIKSNIKNCKFAVIDLTTQNNGAYFEAGYAIALGKTVIITCKEDDFDNIHFDLKQYRCIRWKDFKDLTQKLSQSIIKQKLNNGD